MGVISITESDTEVLGIDDKLLEYQPVNHQYLVHSKLMTSIKYAVR